MAAGHTVTVYNRTTAKAERWVAEHGGAMAMTRLLRLGAEYVFCASVMIPTYSP